MSERETRAKLEMDPIGVVDASRSRAEDDFWGGKEACIMLSELRQPCWADELMRDYWSKRS